MKLNLFAIGATALCFFQQVTATSVGQTNTGNVVQVEENTVSNTNFSPIKRDDNILGGDGLVGEVGKLLDELLGTLGLGRGDLLGLNLGGLSKDLENVLQGLLGHEDNYKGLLTPVRTIYCEEGIDLDDDEDKDDEVTKRKREDSDDNKKCFKVPGSRPNPGLLKSVLDEVKHLLDTVLGGNGGLLGDNLIGGQKGLIPTVVKTVGCLLNELLGNGKVLGDDGLPLLSSKRGLYRREQVKAAIAAKNARK